MGQRFFVSFPAGFSHALCASLAFLGSRKIMSILSEEELNPPHAPWNMHWHDVDHLEKAMFGSAYPEHVPLWYVLFIQCYTLTSVFVQMLRFFKKTRAGVSGWLDGLLQNGWSHHLCRSSTLRTSGFMVLSCFIESGLPRCGCNWSMGVMRVKQQ